MHDIGLLSRMKIGLKKKPIQFCINTFISYATFWTLLEPVISIVPNAGQYITGNFRFIVFLLISIVIGAYKNAVPHEVSIKYGNSNIKIVFGDLFSFDGFQVVPVSRFFHEIEVITSSLQNKLIQKFVQREEGNNGFVTYKNEIVNALKNEKYIEIYRQATQEKEKYYDLGTTALLNQNGQEYLLFALTETELKGNIPDDNCNVSKMWIALEKFWQKARNYSRGSSINIPLIGSGVTGIRLSSIRILEINLLAIANAIEEGGKITTEEIRIVLHPKYIKEINLDVIETTWN